MMIRRVSRFVFIGILAAVTAFAGTVELDASFYEGPDSTWSLDHKLKGKVRNVIFLIGDGMGLPQVASARFHALGPDGRLFMETMPITGINCVHSETDLITDSGASGTAMATGCKTCNKMICTLPDSSEVPTIAEVCRDKGMATGIVATSGIAHATPASFGAHNPHRKHMDELSEDLVVSGIDVMFGGGLSMWLPKEDPASKRKDSRNLVAEVEDRGYKFIRTRDELLRLQSMPVVGLFDDGPMECDEKDPTLAEMAEKAISLLSKERKGFFLMVEGSQIDWGGHHNDENEVIFHLLHFDLAVQKALEFARKDGHTLVVVTADHETGGYSITGGERDGSKQEIHFSTGSHSASPVPVFAFGPGSLRFTGVMDNTSIPHKFAKLLHVTGLAAH